MERTWPSGESQCGHLDGEYFSAQRFQESGEIWKTRTATPTPSTDEAFDADFQSKTGGYLVKN